MRFEFGSSVNILATSNLLIRGFRRVLECAQPVPLVEGSALSVLSRAEDIEEIASLP